MKIWLIVLAVWLILGGAAAVLHLSFEAMPIVMGILAIADGVLILLNK
jgi:hypothetical protein